MNQHPVLYSFRRCPYAMRARMALLVSNQPCELREVVLRDKPAEMVQASPKATVPVLVDTDGEVIEESLDIMRWALQRNDPEHWLAEAGTHQSTILSIEQFEQRFKHHLDRYKYATRYTAEEPTIDPLHHRAQAGAGLTELEATLSSQPFLSGRQRGLADIAIAPFVRQFANTDPAWFEAQPWPALQQWLHDFVNSPLFMQCMQKFPPWQPGDSPVIFADNGTMACQTPTGA